MYWKSLVGALAVVPVAQAATTLRFSCSQLVVDRLDPLVNPGVIPSPHLHQIVGGNAFNVTMDHSTHDQATTATCTTCTASEDFSNYWTAVLFFAAKNGTYKRVNTMGNGLGFSTANGGMTIYYLTTGNTKVTAFKPGFRMTVGDPTFKTASQIAKYPMLTYTCLQTAMTRDNSQTSFPTGVCKAGVMVSIRFPTCWDGKNLDSPNHQSHTAYPSGNACPSTHPVSIPQVFYETVWDTTPFNDQSLWANGKQPFIWSFNDTTGYGSHGDYAFGWKGDALQRAMDAGCSSDLLGNNINCPTLKTQTLAQGNDCSKKRVYNEPLDGYLNSLPGFTM